VKKPANPVFDPHFLLPTSTARELYEAAAAEPIYDYHCHLSPREIADDKQWADVAELWLGGDHYKWRAMRRGRGFCHGQRRTV
jgi:glucuronate isomerase